MKYLPLAILLLVACSANEAIPSPITPPPSYVLEHTIGGFQHSAPMQVFSSCGLTGYPLEKELFTTCYATQYSKEGLEVDAIVSVADAPPPASLNEFMIEDPSILQTIGTDTILRVTNDAGWYSGKQLISLTKRDEVSDEVFQEFINAYLEVYPSSIHEE
jgi:hypothetical protein|tara:strand:- start:448 stop:927 length:480 start_codon:yes stop_codon:yes gene_type:complete